MPSIAVPSPFSESKSKQKKSKKISEALLKPETNEKKRKASELLKDDDDFESETSSELVEPVDLKEKSKMEKKKKKKKAKLSSESDEETVKEENPNAVSNFRISEKLRDKLKEKGIESLFPIQAMTFDTILDGSDLVGRARTGQVCISLCTLHSEVD